MSALDPDQQRWLDAAGELTPEKSLARIEATAKQLLTGITLITTALTGFGVVNADRLRATPRLLGASIGLTALSMALALWATMGRATQVNLNDLDAIRDFYSSKIRRAARLVGLSGLTFVAALTWASAVAIADAQPAPAVSPAIQVQWTRDGGGLKLSVHGDVADATHGSLARLVAITTRDGKQLTLLNDESIVDASGKASFANSVSPMAGTGEVIITVSTDGTTPQSRTLTTEPPSGAATPAPAATSVAAAQITPLLQSPNGGGGP